MPTFALLIALAAAPVHAPAPAPRVTQASATARVEIVTLEQVRPQSVRTGQAELQRQVDRDAGTIQFY